MVTHPYTTRLIWPTRRRSAFDIESARSRARTLQAQLQEMIMFKHAPLDIWKLAVHCTALAEIGNDPVTAKNARAIARRFVPRRRR
jgi:hypothetical protein